MIQQINMFDTNSSDDTAVAKLQQWPPSLEGIKADWLPVLNQFFESAIGQSLNQKICHALEQGKVIYPPDPLRAFKLIALKDVKVVILGQDPYHTPGMADGLAFSPDFFRSTSWPASL